MESGYAGLKREAVGEAGGDAGGEAGLDGGEGGVEASELSREEGGAGIGASGFGESEGDGGGDIADSHRVVGLGHGDDGEGSCAVGGAFAAFGEGLAEVEFPEGAAFAHRCVDAGAHGLEFGIGEAAGGFGAGAGGVDAFGGGGELRGVRDGSEEGRRGRRGQRLGAGGGGEGRKRGERGDGGEARAEEREEARGHGSEKKGRTEVRPDGLFLGFGGGVDLSEELGGGGLEVVDAAIAANKYDTVGLTGDSMDVGSGFAHAAEGLVGNEAGLQRIGSTGLGDEGGLGRGHLFGGGGVGVFVVFVGGEKCGREAGGKREGENGGGEAGGAEEGGGFHKDGSGVLNRGLENPAEKFGERFMRDFGGSGLYGGNPNLFI